PPDERAVVSSEKLAVALPTVAPFARVAVPTTALSTRIWTVPVGVAPAPVTVMLSGTLALAETAQSALLVVSEVVVMAAPIVVPPPVGVAFAQFVDNMLTSN